MSNQTGNDLSRLRTFRDELSRLNFVVGIFLTFRVLRTFEISGRERSLLHAPVNRKGAVRFCGGKENYCDV